MDKSPDEIRREIEEQVALLKVSTETLEMLIKEVAKLYKMRFDALVDAGFNETQALDIIKARGHIA